MHELESLAYKTARRPVGHGNDATGLAHTKQFSGDALGARSEHRSEHAKHDIETRGGIGKIFGIAFFNFSNSAALSFAFFS